MWNPFLPEFTNEALAGKLAGRSAPIKAILLEQSTVAGLGNLYVDESLYLAGIHPLRPAVELNGGEIARLKDGILTCLSAALAHYDRAREEEWPDPPTSMATWTIPRKALEDCPCCGDSITNIRVRGRGTYFCPGCQPIG